jgi:hypothetical protein
MRRAGFTIGTAVTQSRDRVFLMETNDTSELKQAASKKLYEKPSFRYEQVFVTTALSCGKVDPTLQASCTGSTKS